MTRVPNAVWGGASELVEVALTGAGGGATELVGAALVAGASGGEFVAVRAPGLGGRGTKPAAEALNLLVELPGAGIIGGGVVPEGKGAVPSVTLK